LAFVGVFGGLLWRFPVVGIVVTVAGEVRRFAALGVLGRADRFAGCGSFFPHVRRRHLFF